MNWLAWEQHKKWFLIAGIFLALFAGLLVPTGMHFWHAYQLALATCGQTNSCGQLGNSLFQSSTDQSLFGYVSNAMLFLPIVLGLFWGAPLISKEYAEDTNLLAWTRGVSRRK